MSWAMIRGDTFQRVISCKRGKTPLPLVDGDKVTFTIKKKYSDEEPILQKVVTTFVNGKAPIEVLPSDKTAFEISDYAIPYVYDVQVDFASGAVKTVSGPAGFIVHPGVTD